MDEAAAAAQGLDQVEHQLGLLPSQLRGQRGQVEVAGEPVDGVTEGGERPGHRRGLVEHVPAVRAVGRGDPVVEDEDPHQRSPARRARAESTIRRMSSR